MSDKDAVADSLERFKLSHDHEQENRRLALADIRFALLAEQWDEGELSKRKREFRPALTINRMQAFGRQVINDARQNKPSIKVKPADSKADVKTAEIYNGIIRNIEQQSNASVAYDTGMEGAVYGGFGYWRVKTDYAHDDSFDLDLFIERISNQFSVYGCPYSQACDASDWTQAFIVTQLSHDAFKRKYKGAEIADFDGGSQNQKMWINEDMVQVAEEWVREESRKKVVKLSSGLIIDAEQFKANIDFFQSSGISVEGEREVKSFKVTQKILSGAEVLEDQSDWVGQYIPIIPCYGDEINIEGKRIFKSLIRDAKDAQRMLNYWRTTSTELVALAPKAPFIGKRGSFDFDQARWDTANTVSHAYLEYDGDTAPQRQPFSGVPAGALQEAMNASDDIKSITGLYDASLGAKSNETSGRAIMARQREGDVSTFHFIDNGTRAIRYTGVVLIDLIPKVYNAERVMRVLGEDGKAEMVPVNNGMIDLARGKYDLHVQAGPSFTSQREEFAMTMTEFGRANPAVMPLIMDKIVMAMDFPEAETVAKRFQTMLPPQIQEMESQGEKQEPEKMIPVLMQQLAQAKEQMQQMQQQMQEMQPERIKAQTEQQRAQGDQQRAAFESEKAKAQFHLDEQKLAADIKAQQEKIAIEFEKLSLEREKFYAEQQSAVEASEQSKLGEQQLSIEKSSGESSMQQQLKAMAEQQSLAQQAFTTSMGQMQQTLGMLFANKRVVRDQAGRISHTEVMDGSGL